MKRQLRIAYSRCAVTVDEDLAARVELQADGTVLLPQATDLIERQWQRDHRPPEAAPEAFAPSQCRAFATTIGQ